MTLGEDFSHRALIEKHGNKGHAGYRLLHPGRAGKIGGLEGQRPEGNDAAYNNRLRGYGAKVQAIARDFKNDPRKAEAAAVKMIEDLENDSVLEDHDYGHVLNEIARAVGDKPVDPNTKVGTNAPPGKRPSTPEPPQKTGPNTAAARVRQEAKDRAAANRAALRAEPKTPAHIAQAADRLSPGDKRHGAATRQAVVENHRKAIQRAKDQAELDRLQQGVERDPILNARDKKDLAGEINQRQDAGFGPGPATRQEANEAAARAAASPKTSRGETSRQRADDQAKQQEVQRRIDGIKARIAGAQSERQLDLMADVINNERRLNFQQKKPLFEAIAARRADLRGNVSSAPNTPAKPGVLVQLAQAIQDADSPSAFQAVDDAINQAQISQQDKDRLKRALDAKIQQQPGSGSAPASDPDAPSGWKLPAADKAADVLVNQAKLAGDQAELDRIERDLNSLALPQPQHDRVALALNQRLSRLKSQDQRNLRAWAAAAARRRGPMPSARSSQGTSPSSTSGSRTNRIQARLGLRGRILGATGTHDLRGIEAEIDAAPIADKDKVALKAKAQARLSALARIKVNPIRKPSAARPVPARTPTPGPGPNPNGHNVVAVEVDSAFSDEAAMRAFLDKAVDGLGRKMFDPNRGDLIMMHEPQSAAARRFRSLAQARGINVQVIPFVDRRQAADDLLNQADDAVQQGARKRLAVAFRPAGGTVVSRYGLAERDAIRQGAPGAGAIVIHNDYRAKGASANDPNAYDPNEIVMDVDVLRDEGLNPNPSLRPRGVNVAPGNNRLGQGRPGMSGRPGRRANTNDDISDEALDALETHFASGGGIENAPSAGLWNYIRSTPGRFDVKPNGDRGVSDNFWVTDNGKQPPETWMLKRTYFSQYQDMLNENIAAGILRGAGFDMPVTKYAATPKADEAWMAQRHWVEENAPAASVVPNRRYRVARSLELNDDAIQRIRRGPDPKSVSRMIMFDYLINNNADRHHENYLTVQHPDGSLTIGIIDHGLAFAGYDHVGKRASFGAFWGSYRPQERSGWNAGRTAALVAGSRRKLAADLREAQVALEAVDLDEIRAQMSRHNLEPEQERYMQTWLNEVEYRRNWLRDPNNFNDMVGRIATAGGI